jgi:hypothetical protein
LAIASELSGVPGLVDGYSSFCPWTQDDEKPPLRKFGKSTFQIWDSGKIAESGNKAQENHLAQSRIGTTSDFLEAS